jgi:hypothetical protein
MGSSKPRDAGLAGVGLGRHDPFYKLALDRRIGFFE